jgi:glycyl-tRNA synthetase (class II)
MVEIKSTLDIIMEKAQKLKVSEAEKRNFKRRDLEGKIKGLVQKALDGIMGPEKFHVEMTAFRAKEKDMVEQILKEEIVARIEPGADNETLVRILDNVTEPASGAVRKALAEFEKEVEKQKESSRRLLLEGFKKKGISGSAVLPNLDADPEWARVKSEIRRHLQEEIRKVI